MKNKQSSNSIDEPVTLDPSDWKSAVEQFHRALDLALERQHSIRQQPVWKAPPKFPREAMPSDGISMDKLIDQFEETILPFGTGNTHPSFFGWVHGSGNIHGALGEALAALMNCNVGGRNHIGTTLEKTVIAWFTDFFGFPSTASGILTSGTSMGTLIALTCARNDKASWDIQKEGVGAADAQRMVAYASVEAHSCLIKTLDIIGLGRSSLRLIPVDSDFRMDVEALNLAIRNDRDMGFLPFCIISTIGTVNTGAIDNIRAIADIASRENLWHHIDAAFGAFSICLPKYREIVSDISSADSLAFDMHKWLHVPYDVGCVLIRDEEVHRKTFALRKEYLKGESDGIAGGEPWFCDYGPELSRCFRALKIWFTLKGLGFNALKRAIIANCEQAQRLAENIQSNEKLELLAPVSLNIVCFRVLPKGVSNEEKINSLNRTIVATLQKRGLAVPSITELSGRVAIRVCITNHRTSHADLEKLLADVLAIEYELTMSK